jgi:hypothetical protein
MSKKLTPEYVVMRTKCDRLEKLKNLNLWGCDLEDITVLKQIPNLEVVSLSVNRIKSLKEFGTLKHLKELYLRKNFVSDISELRYLEKCPNLKVLWLSENPIADTKDYRKIVIRTLPNLGKLDDNLISVEERNRAMEDGDDEEDNYNPRNDDDNRSSDSIDPKEENVFETKNFYNKNMPVVSNNAVNVNVSAGKLNKKNSNDNFNFKKNNNAYEDTLDNETKSSFNFVKEKKSNNIMPQNTDMYPIQNEPKKIIKEKAPITNRYNYDYQQHEEPNVVEKFENLNLGGGAVNNVYTKKNDLRRESRMNNDPKNNDNAYNNQEHRNEFRNDLGKKNSIKSDNYNETLREFNNLNPRKSNDNIPIKTQTSNNINNRSSNVMNCVLMLLKELNEYDLEIVRDEINQKLGNR